MKKTVIKAAMNYSIWIKKEDDGTFDVNVWDEDNNERDDNLEACKINDYKQAEITLLSIIKNNPNINFERRDNE